MGLKRGRGMVSGINKIPSREWFDTEISSSNRKDGHGEKCFLIPQTHSQSQFLFNKAPDHVHHC